MDIDIENYLSNDVMKTIATRIYTEKIEAEAIRIIEARAGGKLVDTIFGQVVAACVTDLSDKFKDNILLVCESEVNRTSSNSEDYDDTLKHNIQYSLQAISKNVINEHIDEIKQIVYTKVLECANETVALAFIGDIIRGLDLNSAVKEVLQNRFNK